MKCFQRKFLKFWDKNFSNLPTIGFIALLFFISLGFFYKVVFQGKVALPSDALVGAHIPWVQVRWPEYPAGVPIKNLEITDSFSQFFPWRSLAGEFWRRFTVPLWNDYMFSGAPFLATLHSAALYPLNIVYLFFSDIDSWNILVFLQIFLSAVFMFILVREVTRDNVASGFAAIAFGFCGYMIGWLEFATGGHAGLWLPLILFLQLKFFAKRDARILLVIALIFFFVLTAGDFQVPFYSSVLYIFFSFFLSFKAEKKLKNFFIYITPLFLGLLLSLIQWLPTIDLYLDSIRVGDSYIKEYFYGIAHWEKIVNFIWPDFFGNVVTRNYWGKFGYHEYLAFSGSLTVVMVFFSLVTKKTKIERFFLWALFVSLLFLFPTPLSFVPYVFGIPGLATSSASRIIFLIDFCLSFVAGVALAKLNRSNLFKLRLIIFYFLIASLGVGVGIVLSLVILSPYRESLQIWQNLQVSLRNMVPTTVVLFVSYLLAVYLPKFQARVSVLKSILFFILVAEMIRFGWKNTPFSERKFVFPSLPVIEFLQEKTDVYRIAGGIPTNLFMPFKIKSLEGYDSIYPLKNSLWYSYINSGTSSSLSGRYGLIHNFASPLLDISSVKYVIDYKKNRLGEPDVNGTLSSGVSVPKYKLVYKDGYVEVFENVSALPIAWVTDKYKVVGGDNEIFDMLLGNTVNSRTVLLREDPNISINPEGLRYEILHYNMDLGKVDIVVRTNKNSLLFLSQTSDPGWRAYVNGIRTPIYTADFLYQSIVMPKGYSVIRFEYFPLSFRIGRDISFLTFVFIVLAFAFLKIRSMLNFPKSIS